jgi:2-C-methyl-D-erythritol 4-phosphate cytidylyltransferase/2-C-methyl-D-erythritol 2,4-cyclodiphosphate synthase
MIAWAVAALKSHAAVQRLVVVIDPSDQALFESACPGVAWVPGGATRTASVRAGMAALAAQGGFDAVLIHDAARPGLSAPVIDRVLTALQTADAAAPALPPADALKQVDGEGRVIAAAAREGVVRVQTPQAIWFDRFQAALAGAGEEQAFDDDIALAMAAGLSARLVPGDALLMKATYPQDFAVLERLIALPLVPRQGTGVDAHRFGPGDHVMLCGVKIPHDKGLIGHSDADAAWHALTDALLGALALGDIGDHFPPSDPQWKGAASEVFLAHAAKLVRDAGARIVNVDVTLMCERPKIKPHREAMRARTAQVLGVDISRVSVKATTTEGMGFLGREEGLAAQASVQLLCPETEHV